MFISSLKIQDFRNLCKVELECSPGLNVIVGENASGKTSLLEALYFLGRGRSFRTHKVHELIGDGRESFSIIAFMMERTGSRPVVVGIKRDRREMIARVDGIPIHSLAQLAARVPVLFLNPDSHRLLENGPKLRRRFMDWGLFYREATFIGAWKRYRSALANRNAVLRGSSSDQRSLDAWDRELACAAATVARLRHQFCVLLQESLQSLVPLLLGEMRVTVDYRRGWDAERDLIRLLQENRQQDLHYGYTRSGAHRADFIVRLNGTPATERLSRGQHKLLIVAMILAQANLYNALQGRCCMLLIDDLPAELDRLHRRRVMDCLSRMSSQIFATTIEPELLCTTAWKELSVFNIHSGNVNNTC